MLLMSYAVELDDEIASMPNLKVIVACGGPAMTRLTGRRSKKDKGWGIERYHNFIFRNADIPQVMEWASGVRHLTRLPENLIIIPVLHPAGIMRSKGRDEMLSFRRGCRKVYRAINDQLQKVTFHESFAPPVKEIEDAFRDSAGVVYFDTEYDRTSRQVSWCGFNFDDCTVYGVPWTVEYVQIISHILSHAKTLGAHNIQADLQSLAASGLALLPSKVWCTLVGHHALHPALGVGLDDAARYYIDDIQQWKDLETDDPHYNALDVAYGRYVMNEQRKEAAARSVDPIPEIEARMRLIPICMNWEKRGMNVDQSVQKQLVASARTDVAQLRTRIGEATTRMWDKRVRETETMVLTVESSLQKLRTDDVGKCGKHPKRNGLFKPPKHCDVCTIQYESMHMARMSYAKERKALTRVRGEAKRWVDGFNPSNNEHLRWLLYSPDALRLPVQYTGYPRRPTANRTAIDKLSTLRAVQIKQKAFAVVMDIKEVQHLEKAVSTFIEVPLDSEGIGHPPYKIQGTRTGRLAGGKDDDAKADNKYAFNVLNIPREWRHMWVAPAEHCLVAADWRNVEGRLMAHFCKDLYYNKVLDDELKGGPKVHSVNAAIIYGIDPADAKTHKIKLSGQERDAYDGGKRLSHAWSYGMQPPHMSRTFNITLKEAVTIDLKLSDAYKVLVNYRQQLIIDILGIWETIVGGRGMRCIKAGRRFLATPFGWQMHFNGINAMQANEVIAFLPQSTGAGMFTRCAPTLEARYPVFTGTYDSFVLVVPATTNDVREAREFLTETMEQPWPQLGGKTFPSEIAVGYNWGTVSDSNPRGLQEVE